MNSKNLPPCIKAVLLLLLQTVGTLTSKAANPTYKLSITNQVAVSSSRYEFDVYLLRTGADPLELATFQMGLGFDINIINGGTLSAVILPGTSQLPAAMQPTS